MTILIIALIIVSICSILSILIYVYNDRINVELIGFEYDEFTGVMAVESVSKTGKFFTETYTGNGTVWFRLPEYKRCNEIEEKVLNNLYTTWKQGMNTK